MEQRAPETPVMENYEDEHRQIEAYLQNEPCPRLHLGTGRVALPGWLNSDSSPLHPDYLPIDAAEPLPLPNDSINAVFCEHLIEHLSFTAGTAMVAEVFRILKPGGVIRVSTPDLQRLRGLIAKERNSVQNQYVRVVNSPFGENPYSNDPTFTLNSSFYNHGHRSLYTRGVLRQVFEKAGFESLSWTTPLVSKHQMLTGLEHHGRLLGDERLNSIEHMVLEGSKPSVNERP
ncbi:methyltransferase domain-containing protein [Corynebacterium sp. TAE3-ERU12]|uniref:class I SAM-dependent methyltransferase n=1 Tax=Corynebacterium sp. TAE3-ERU12 TaxID=2849491 RepID=UPI001C4873FD|nr:methyltransferase domain-containing protein [Corynebacterium sp. TAE3-ERU12]